MLVLGTQGHGGLKGVDLGSTADKCLRLARCNVIVIRPSKRGWRIGAGAYPAATG
jgi:nucleotide-binding universal stress UspA family protein